MCDLGLTQNGEYEANANHGDVKHVPYLTESQQFVFTLGSLEERLTSVA